VVVILVSVGILHAEDALTLLWLGSLVNVVLSLLKAVLAQVTVHRKALMADALHGLGDTAAQVVAALAYSQAARPPDKDYPWGYGKIESMGTLLVAGILLYAAVSIGWDSATSLFQQFTEWRATKPSVESFSPGSSHLGSESQSTQSCAADSPAVQAPIVVGSSLPQGGASLSKAAIGVAVASIALKEALFRATLGVGINAESRLAVATAWQHRSDSLSAGVALLSQLGAAHGHHYLDAVGGSVVASMLAESAFGSLKDSLADLLDYNTAAESSDVGARCGREAVGASIVTVPGVRNHTLRMRRMGPYCLVDATIVVDARISASAASMVAEAVHNQVIEDFHPFVTDVVVHVDPDGSPQYHRLDPEAEPGASGSAAGHFHPSAAGTPEIVEERVREALRSLGARRPDLPEILKITELQTYYAESAASDPTGAFVDVKVDLQLPLEHTTLRDAQQVARAARRQVLDALPGIVREVDVDLELDEVGEEHDDNLTSASEKTQ
jgi:divalent metal cation (Fe/Co/Zn/Cd) transporter